MAEDKTLEGEVSLRTATVEREGYDPEANSIYVTSQWTARQGATLVPGLQLGKVLGAGMQGQIFELLDDSGTIAPIVLKAAKKGALISDLEREWGAGQKIAQLAGPDGDLPGFMKVGPALRRPDDKLVGQILERINGKSVSAIMAGPDWHDVRYLRTMLFTVLTALDLAQRRFGFHHCDFRLENVMEHTPDPSQVATDAISLAVLGDPKKRVFERTFKTIDYGLAKFDDTYSAAHGWLEEEAKGNEVEEHVRVKRLAWPEWIHKKAWKGKGDVYHIVFDTIQFVYGTIFPMEDSTLVTLMNMLFAHICGVMPKVFIENSGESDMPAVDHTNAHVSRMESTKYTATEQSVSFLGKQLQIYYRWSRIHRWGRKVKAWYWPKNPGVSAAEVLTSPFFSPYAVLDVCRIQSRPSIIPEAYPEHP